MSHPDADADASQTTLRILLVNQQALDQQLISATLARSDLACQLRRVATAQEFRAALDSPVDLVLSEIELPQFGALAALRMLRELQRDIPLILVTDFHDEDRATRLLDLGASDYVLKDRLGRMAQAIRLATSQSALRQRLRQKNATMAHLSLQLVKAQEAERANLARELHDELGQRMTALNMLLYRLQPDAASPLQPVWQEASHTLGALVDQARNLSMALRPPELDYVGLQAAISHLLARRYAGLWDSQVFEYVGLPHRLPPLVEITCYRLVQESLTNIARHAQARSVVIEMIGNGDVVDIIVRDDGVGFDIGKWERGIALRPSGGVIGMRERAALLGGALAIDSQPGHGTRIGATLPLNDGDAL
ncbi:histidine kinase [Oxalobacteraceae bacterium A2-2]